MIFNIIYSEGTTQMKIITLVCVLVAVILALSLHEFAHAFVAHKCGDDTAKNNGRMTMNPIKHIDPFGFIMLMILGFGFAKPVPINPYNFKKQRRDYFLVSVAGITVNFILAVISSFLYVVFSVIARTLILEALAVFFLYFLFINIGLMVFNLLPIFPLDGFRIVEAAFGRTNKFINFMRKYGQYILFGLLIWSVVLSWVIPYVPDAAANILQYFDVLGFTLGFLINNISGGLVRLWSLIFF